MGTAEKALETATNSVFIRECITSPRQIDMPKTRSQRLGARLLNTSELGVSDFGNLIPRNYTISGFVCSFVCLLKISYFFIMEKEEQTEQTSTNP